MGVKKIITKNGYHFKLAETPDGMWHVYAANYNLKFLEARSFSKKEHALEFLNSRR